MVKQCPMCNEYFEAKKGAKYCDKCRGNGTSFICEDCGKTVFVKFDTYRKYLNKENHVFRCAKCGLADTEGHAVSLCGYCGCEFKAKTTDKYCTDCKAKGVSVRCCVCDEIINVSTVVYVREMKANPDKIWIHKECSAEFRRQMWTEEMRQEMALKHKKRWEDEEYREKFLQSHAAAHNTNEYRERMSKLATERMSEVKNREHISEILTEFYVSEEGKIVKERISESLRRTNGTEEARKANSLRLKAFFASEQGKENSKRHSVKRKAFFATEEGIAERAKMSERQKLYCKSAEGQETLHYVQQKRAEWLQTEDGLKFRERQAYAARKFFKTSAGKKVWVKGYRTRKLNQLSNADGTLDIEIMRGYWPGLSDYELLDKHKQFLLKTTDADFWVEISEYVYAKAGRCSRRNLSEATGIYYSTVVWALQTAGVPPLVKEYRKELEDEVADFVVSNFTGDVKIRQRYGFLLNKNGNKQELDIYIPEKNLAIEVNGTYWHSAAHKDKYYHYNKSKLCRENGIRLIHIWEHEWNDERQRPILEAMVLSALGQSKRVFARKLSIENRSSKEMREFFQTNNIQGFRGGEFAVCLVYPSTKEVLMAYLIGKGNHMSKGYQYEVVRGASKLGYTIIGGSSKLLNFIMQIQGIKQLVYYIDYNYFDGRSLIKDSNWILKSEQVSFKNFWKATGEVKNREPAKHKEITEKYITGEVLQLWNAGVATYVYTKDVVDKSE